MVTYKICYWLGYFRQSLSLSAPVHKAAMGLGKWSDYTHFGEIYEQQHVFCNWWRGCIGQNGSAFASGRYNEAADRLCGIPWWFLSSHKLICLYIIIANPHGHIPISHIWHRYFVLPLVLSLVNGRFLYNARMQNIAYYKGNFIQSNSSDSQISSDYLCVGLFVSKRLAIF